MQTRFYRHKNLRKWLSAKDYDFQNNLTPQLKTQYNNYQTTVNANITIECD
tara:strand:- start:277117 stop:277269 length:153 start_codon:yes stop_codon:yes gene_type:complete